MPDPISLQVSVQPTIRGAAASNQPVPLNVDRVQVIEAVSPTVDLEQTEDTLTITVTDVHGTESATIPTAVSNIRRGHGNLLTPIYIGDYLCPSTRVPSCCVKIGNYFYAFDAPTNAAASAAQSNAGVIRKFDTVNNVEVTADAQTADIGHANSCAFDGTTVYVAPIWDFTSGTATTVSYLYTFDSTMTPTGTETIPSPAMGVSFDPVTETLYYYTNAAPKQIYAKRNGTWTAVCTVDFTNVPVSEFGSNAFNQDFAVYDGYFYISSPNGAVVSGAIESPVSTITASYLLDGQDTTARFMLGELEGFEFDTNGHLYTTMYSGLSDEILNGFVVELSVGVTKPNTPTSDKYEFHDGTLTLSEESQIRFWNSPASLRSLLQLEIRTMRYNSSVISIPLGNDVVENYPIRINDKIRLDLHGSLTVKNINVFNGYLNLSAPEADDGTPRLIFTDNTVPIHLERVGELAFTGTYSLRISTPYYTDSQLIGVGHDFNRTSIRNPPISDTVGRTWTIGENVVLQSASTYVGTSQFFRYATLMNPTHFTNPYFSKVNVQQGGFYIYQLSGFLYAIVCRLRVMDGVTMPAGTNIKIGTLPQMGLMSNQQQTITDGYGQVIRVTLSGQDLKVHALTDVTYTSDNIFYSSFVVVGGSTSA